MSQNIYNYVEHSLKIKMGYMDVSWNIWIPSYRAFALRHKLMSSLLMIQVAVWINYTVFHLSAHQHFSFPCKPPLVQCVVRILNRTSIFWTECVFYKTVYMFVLLINCWPTNPCYVYSLLYSFYSCTVIATGLRKCNCKQLEQ